MAKSFNQVIIMGNLAADPELRTVPSGQTVASFTVATNRVWQDANGERQEQADFHDVVAWAKLAELVGQYLSKGRKVLVSGRLQNRTWEADDGTKRKRTEIVANDVSFLDPPSGTSGDVGARDDTAVAASSKASEGTQAGSAKPATKDKKSKDKDENVEIEDLGDDPVDLSEIPF